jgi:hypothetical protein
MARLPESNYSQSLVLNQSPIPDITTRARSVEKLKRLTQQLDQHIADLDELTERLEHENRMRLEQVRQRTG